MPIIQLITNPYTFSFFYKRVFFHVLHEQIYFYWLVLSSLLYKYVHTFCIIGFFKFVDMFYTFCIWNLVNTPDIKLQLNHNPNDKSWQPSVILESIFASHFRYKNVINNLSNSWIPIFSQLESQNISDRPILITYLHNS